MQKKCGKCSANAAGVSEPTQRQTRPRKPVDTVKARQRVAHVADGYDTDDSTPCCNAAGSDGDEPPADDTTTDEEDAVANFGKGITDVLPE